MSAQLEITGKIHVINEIQTFASGFIKREFVIETYEKYPQMIKFEAVKERCAALDKFEIDDVVTVGFNVRGNEHNGKYYVSLTAWKISGVQMQHENPPNQPAPKPVVQPKPDADYSKDETDSIPF